MYHYCTQGFSESYEHKWAEGFPNQDLASLCLLFSRAYVFTSWTAWLCHLLLPATCNSSLPTFSLGSYHHLMPEAFLSWRQAREAWKTEPCVLLVVCAEAGTHHWRALVGKLPHWWLLARPSCLVITYPHLKISSGKPLYFMYQYINHCQSHSFVCLKTATLAAFQKNLFLWRGPFWTHVSLMCLSSTHSGAYLLNRLKKKKKGKINPHPFHNWSNWGRHISTVAFKKNNLSFAKIKNVPNFLHASVKSLWIYNLLRKGTSVSNWWNSAFIMDDVNELNSFVSNSVVDYKLIRNPPSSLPPPPQICLAFAVPCVLFFSCSPNKSWRFSVSQAIINEILPYCHDLSTIFLECMCCTNPPSLGLWTQGTCWD